MLPQSLLLPVFNRRVGKENVVVADVKGVVEDMGLIPKEKLYLEDLLLKLQILVGYQKILILEHLVNLSVHRRRNEVDQDIEVTRFVEMI